VSPEVFFFFHVCSEVLDVCCCYNTTNILLPGICTPHVSISWLSVITTFCIVSFDSLYESRQRDNLNKSLNICYITNTDFKFLAWLLDCCFMINIVVFFNKLGTSESGSVETFEMSLHFLLTYQRTACISSLSCLP